MTRDTIYDDMLLWNIINAQVHIHQASHPITRTVILTLVSLHLEKLISASFFW